MTLHVHELRGCAPTPLAHYLKALAILRLVASQADAEARGLWRDGVFYFASRFDRAALERFFLEEYRPSPMLSPWNGGSGFYPKDNHSGIDPLAQTQAARFAAFADAIRETRKAIDGSEEKPSDEAKALLQRRCVSGWSAEAHAWVSAAFVVDEDGSPSYPALLGTGGNDGRLDFTNNYMQRLVELFDAESGAPRAAAAPLLDLALFGEPAEGLASPAIGQFHPGAAGGANATTGYEADGLVNPWDFVLMLEGALTLRVGALRRLDSGHHVQASAPFALRSNASGYASAAGADSSARGEQWMPLWSRPATFDEVAALFDEGRLQTARGGAADTLDACRALAGLGTARGVASFVRFGFFERNGQSNLAVPIGRIEVCHRPEARVLDEIDGYLRQISYAASATGAPASLGRAARALERAAIATAVPSARPATWGELVSTLGDVEHVLVTHDRSTAAANLRPVPLLSERWLELIDDDPETRLAVAIASQYDRDLGPVRVNAAPLAAPRYDRFATTADGLATGPGVVWRARSLVDDLASLALRRVHDAEKHGAPRFPLMAKRNARLDDVRLFLDGRVDDARVSRLARGLMALDWRRVERTPTPSRGVPAPLHALTRLAYLPFDVEPIKPRRDATGLRLLAAGRLADATRALSRTLVGAGLRPRLRIAAGGEELSRRLAASVAIPISHQDCARLVEAVAKPFQEEHSP